MTETIVRLRLQFTRMSWKIFPKRMEDFWLISSEPRREWDDLFGKPAPYDLRLYEKEVSLIFFTSEENHIHFTIYSTDATSTCRDSSAKAVYSHQGLYHYNAADGSAASNSLLKSQHFRIADLDTAHIGACQPNAISGALAKREESHNEQQLPVIPAQSQDAQVIVSGIRKAERTSRTDLREVQAIYPIRSPADVRIDSPLRGGSGHHTGLVRVLSFDSGGVRGLAQLRTLECMFETQQLRQRIPADCFDLIVGCKLTVSHSIHVSVETSLTSSASAGSGGLLAILLGTFRLGIKDATECYDTLITLMALFHHVNEPAQSFSKAVMNKAGNAFINSLFSRAGLPRNSPMLRSAEGTCHVAIPASRSAHLKGVPAIFRSYDCAHASSQSWLTETRKVIDLCLADLLEVKSMGTEDVDYLDGSFLIRNPAKTAYNESLINIYSGRKIGLLVSIGSGIPAPLELKTAASNRLRAYTTRELADLADNANSVHNDMYM